MTVPATLAGVFAALRPILAGYSTHMVVVHDAPGHFSLNTSHIMPNKKPLFFGAVEIRKAYVSFHLMPVYVFPELLAQTSVSLRRRMQGKSCFHFNCIDTALFDEVTALVCAGHERYVEAGYVAASSHQQTRSGRGRPRLDEANR